MDLSINERLAETLKMEKIKQVDLAKKLNVSSQYISGVVNGKNPVGIEMLKLIAEMCPSLNVRWLLTGNGPAYERRLPKATNVKAMMLADNLLNSTNSAIKSLTDIVRFLDLITAEEVTKSDFREIFKIMETNENNQGEPFPFETLDNLLDSIEE